MVYPSTYNEMFVWIGIDQFRQYFDLTDDQLESLYESMRTKKSLSVVGKPDGTILNQLTNGTVEEIKTNSHVPDIMEAVAVTATGMSIRYTAAYLAAQRAASSSIGGSGSNSNNSNKKNNNNT